MAFYMRKAANGYVIEELKSPLSVDEAQIEDTWVVQGDAVEVVNEVIKILYLDDQVEATWIEPESSEGESTEDIIERNRVISGGLGGSSPAPAVDYVKHSSFDPVIAALSNGTTHLEQQD